MPYKVKNNCVYKKEDNSKVGCTKGSIKKYLAALHANANESTDMLAGGKADTLSVSDIANKFNVPVTKIEHELSLGIKVEQEHTKDVNLAKEIAMDHLSEMPDYYSRLKKMEKAGEKDLKNLNEHDQIKFLLRLRLTSIK
jgi:hypothetical protein